MIFTPKKHSRLIRFLFIEYQFVRPNSTFRWQNIWWYKPSWSSRSVAIGAQVENNFDENTLVACSEKCIDYDYRSWAVDTYVMFITPKRL